jgi:hypothetical protein
MITFQINFYFGNKINVYQLSSFFTANKKFKISEHIQILKTFIIVINFF